MKRLGVLVSGSGTNLQSILDAQQDGRLGGAEVRVVVSNVEGVRALERASAAGVPAEVMSHRAFASREAFDAALIERLRAYDVELVVLAGFMRLITQPFLDAFPVINIHPSLLPAFPGVHAARQALAHGVKLTGSTVHFVDRGCDTGPIIAQAAVPVLEGDDEARLIERIHGQEHHLFPMVIRALTENRIRLIGRRVEGAI